MQNPFVSSGLIALLLIAALWLYTVGWTFLDADTRFRRGWAWLVIAAVLPFVGCGFYLLYRRSSLVEYDEQERAERVSISRDLKRWTWRRDRDTVRAFFTSVAAQSDKERSRLRERAITFRRRYSLRELWRGFVVGFRANMRRTAVRMKPKPRPRLTYAPKEQAASVDAQADGTVVAATSEGAEKAAPSPEPKYGKRGSSGRKRERKKQKYEEMLDFLAETPQEDSYLEELIYNGKYALALEIARDNLSIAREMSDARKVVTYEKYVARLKELE